MRRQQGQLLFYAIAAIAVLAMLSGIAYKIRESGKDAVRIEWAAANEEQRAKEAEQAATASTNLEKGNEKAKVVYRTITKEVDKIVERPVYRNVCLDDDGLRSARQAISGKIDPLGKSDKPVLKPARVGGWDGRVSLALDYGSSRDLLGVQP